MQRWDLATLDHADDSGPRVLFSTPEARCVVIDLAAGEELGDHRVRERSTLLVLSGQVEIGGAGSGEQCNEGALLLFEPSEGRHVSASEDSRLLLTLAPWPAPDHYDAAEQEDPSRLPSGATQPPSSGGGS